MKKVSIMLALAMLAITAPALAGQFYKWVDAQGTTHYTTTPPPDNTPGQEVRTRNTASSDQPQAIRERQQAHTRQQASSSTAEDTGAAGNGERAARNKELQEHCARLRKNRDALVNRPIVRIRNPATGEMEVIDQEKRKKLLADTREGLEICKQ